MLIVLVLTKKFKSKESPQRLIDSQKEIHLKSDCKIYIFIKVTDK